MPCSRFKVQRLSLKPFGVEKIQKEEIMKKQILTVLLTFTFGLGLTLLASTGAMAVHKGSTGLTCGSCHTMHSSQGNATMGSANGSLRLIRGAGATTATTAGLCLTCHAENGGSAGTSFNTGGWATTPPKVYLTTNWTATDPIDFSAVGAGGDFGYIGNYNGTDWNLAGAPEHGAAGTDNSNALGKGHSLELAQVTALPPGNNVTGVSVGAALTGTTPFTCTSCHDAHGTSVTTNGINFFRNLKADTNNRGANAWSNMATYGDVAQTYVGAAAGSATGGSNVALASNIWPVINVAASTQNVYTYDNKAVTLNGKSIGGAGTVGISAFCAQCHGAWHEKLADGAGGWSNNTNGANDWNRHPVNNFLNDGTTASGSGNTIVDTAAYGFAGTKTSLPTANATTSTKYYMDTAATSKVFCLSCHFAHGGPYNDGLRWNHTASVSSGDQVGNTITSSVGCNQCHNK